MRVCAPEPGKLILTADTPYEAWALSDIAREGTGTLDADVESHDVQLTIPTIAKKPRRVSA